MKITSNIDEVIKAFQKEEMAISKGAINGVKKITQDAYEELQKQCIDANLSNHIGNIEVKYPEANNGIGEISTNDQVIVFNEYGTGVVGKDNPHPALEGWEYDVNNHGEEGWIYPKKDGTFGRTSGIASKKMFYNTKEKMLQKDIAKEILIEIERLEK